MMPRARLGKGSWQFEDDALAALRAKITAGRKTLGETVGSPLRGLLTGLNEAFVITRKEADTFIADQPDLVDLVRPFLSGKEVQR